MCPPKDVGSNPTLSTKKYFLFIKKLLILTVEVKQQLTLLTMANLRKETLDTLKDEGLNILLYEDYYDDEVVDDPSKANHMLISGDYNESIVFESISLPKRKEVTVEWVLNKIDKESKFVNISELIKNKLGTSTFYIYPTSYGVGVSVLFSLNEQMKSKVDDVVKVLKENNIEYRNEYSEAGWVYRFVISKSAENLKRIDNITI